MLLEQQGVAPVAPTAADLEPSQQLPPPASGELPACKCVLLAAQTRPAHAALPARGSEVMPGKLCPLVLIMWAISASCFMCHAIA